MNGYDLNNGLMWKQIYLPCGTKLRTSHRGRDIFATVTSGKVHVPSIGRAFDSPNEACSAMRGDTSNNAWKEFWICAPDGREYHHAMALRDRPEELRRFITQCGLKQPELQRVPAMASDAKNSDATSVPAPEPRYIDMTPTWRGLMPLLIEVAANGDSAGGRKGALDELNRLADMADGFGPRMDAMRAALKAFIEATKDDPKYAGLILQAAEAMCR